MNNCTPYWDCHELQATLAMTSLWIPPLAPFVIARLRRSRGNPQTTIFLFIHRKEKEIIVLYPLRHCEEWNDEAIHKPQKTNAKTEKKKNSINE